MIMLNAFASALHSAINWAANLFDGSRTFPFINADLGLGANDRALMTYDSPESEYFLIDLVPVVAIVALAIFLFWLAILSALLHRSEAVTPDDTSAIRRTLKYRAAEAIHATVLRLPLVAALSVILATPVAAAVIVWLYSAIYRQPFLASIVLFIVNISAGLALILLITRGRLHTSKSIFSTLADVAGFWPPIWTPFAGVHYRDRVVDGIEKILQETRAEEVALVGHSQGSVVAAWLAAARTSTASPKLHLVTCGSPLQSLYATFFPSYFDKAFFHDAKNGSNSWLNLWRKTDYIGTSLRRLHKSIEDVEVLDGIPRLIKTYSGETVDASVRAHGEYWVEQEMFDYIHGLASVSDDVHEGADASHR
ncbi:alpha/beta fold hydrolase [Actinomycetospora termitidis]|uniref:AB hydrolase-1 domain-containing protein n=1 Tax=Actinomycetospora termitidis TaxID=3053470 RepID=A0ABT7M5S5_9PSEU|nr:alpha/beta fold hydrolase [Actinomycetospora sp. Odt1-22]MDL5156025.1 hypothetical protein [Actinomycetospora sp. Odt1-22]